MSNLYNFKRIQVVPQAKDFVDVVLSKTQRKTPTEVHKSYPITRIRSFYMRKCKFTQQTFDEKLTQLLADFPKLDDIHPFYGDLMNVLYDRDHYKLALGQINSVKHQIDNISKDYLKLLKYGDSLYRCKQLKRACLGRMVTLMLRQKDTLTYLEQVRQHLSRLPSIDPNTRTLLITGFPNVGKSSFMNKVTRANVDVQPYAFTTKSLFVGHMDYKYLRWQVIDTPGILDHPLEDRNTIEMQSITALAHLRACVLYFVDLSEQCGYNIAAQVALYNSIKPLFTNKPLVLVLNKVDLVRYEQLSDENKSMIEAIVAEGATTVESSSFTDEGVMHVKQVACDKLLASRVEMKMRNKQVGSVLNKLHLAEPVPRDEKARPAAIPEAALTQVKYDKNDPNRRKLARDIEAENGGPGIYAADFNQQYILKNDSWKHDAIPEIWNGKNVADFVDPDIEEKLLALEREEERLISAGFYDNFESEEEDDEEEEEEDEMETAGSNLASRSDAAKSAALRKASKSGKAAIAEALRKKKIATISASREKKLTRKNKPQLPRKAVARSLGTNIEKHLEELGASDATIAEIHARKIVRRDRSLSRARDEDGEDRMDVDDQDDDMKSGHLINKNRNIGGLRGPEQAAKARKMHKKQQRNSNLMAKAGESDRHVATKMPKHLFAGKRKMGKTDRR